MDTLNAKYLSPDIPALEKFKRYLEMRCRSLILQTEPMYYEKIEAEFHKHPIKNLNYQEYISAYVPFLNKKYANLAQLLGSLYEVKRGWKKFLIAYLLIQLPSPTSDQNINAHEWWRFCHDSIWFADYGYCEKLIAFLIILRRNLKGEASFNAVSESISLVNDLKNVTKKVRDPLTHNQSIALDKKSYEIFWQLYLALGYKYYFSADPLEMIDSLTSLDKNNTAKKTQSWIRSNYIITSNIFGKLNKISINALCIDKEHKS